MDITDLANKDEKGACWLYLDWPMFSVITTNQMKMLILRMIEMSLENIPKIENAFLFQPPPPARLNLPAEEL